MIASKKSLEKKRRDLRLLRELKLKQRPKKKVTKNLNIRISKKIIAAQEAKEAEINKAKFDIDETPNDDEEEKDEDILKEPGEENKENGSEPVVKDEKVEKLLNSIQHESKGDDEELEEDDLDDYISKLEQKTA